MPSPMLHLRDRTYDSALTACSIRLRTDTIRDMAKHETRMLLFVTAIFGLYAAAPDRHECSKGCWLDRLSCQRHQGYASLQSLVGGGMAKAIGIAEALEHSDVRGDGTIPGRVRPRGHDTHLRPLERADFT